MTFTQITGKLLMFHPSTIKPTIYWTYPR